MRKQIFLRGLILLVVAGFWVSSAGAKKHPSVQKILQKFHARSQNIQTLQADFQQTFHWTMVDETQTFTGTLIIGRGDRFRLQTPEQVIVSDGKTLWTYDKGKNQVLVDDAQHSGDDLLPRKLLLKFEKNYTAVFLREEKVGGIPCYVIELTSKTDDTFIPKMTVWIDEKTYVTRRLRYTDVNENVTTYNLRKIKINQPVPESVFRYQIPKGVDVIDMRAE